MVGESLERGETASQNQEREKWAGRPEIRKLQSLNVIVKLSWFCKLSPVLPHSGVSSPGSCLCGVHSWVCILDHLRKDSPELASSCQGFKRCCSGHSKRALEESFELLFGPSYAQLFQDQMDASGNTKRLTNLGEDSTWAREVRFPFSSLQEQEVNNGVVIKFLIHDGQIRLKGAHLIGESLKKSC